MTCRFRFLRKTQRKSSVAICGRTNKRTYIALPRNHCRLNAYNEQLMRTWRGTVDLQLIADARGSAQYVTRVAHYASAATKPEKEALDWRLRLAIERMQPGMAVRSRMVRIANAPLGARQVPIQQAIAVLLGERVCPIVESSRQVVVLNISKREEAPALIDLAELREADDAETERIYSQKKIVECYYRRPIDGRSTTFQLGGGRDQRAAGAVGQRAAAAVRAVDVRAAQPETARATAS